MRKNIIYLLVAVLSTTALVSCNGLKKMEKYIEELGAKATPNPLEVHGDSIAISITGKFPPKYFAKKASVEATPVLIHGGSETKFKMKGYQGEQAAGNFEKIPYKEGKSFSYSDKVAYVPSMESSKLELRLFGQQGSKSKEFGPVQVADGVITTPYLIKSDDKAIESTDKFVRTLSKNKEAVINFDYNSSNLKAPELKDADINALSAFLDSVGKNPKLVLKSIEFVSYASPEGEMLLNDNLANERAEAGKKALNDILKKNKVTVNETLYTLSPKGEDWEGFRAAMEKSNIEDRNIIINVLKMTGDLQQREKEIKNISKTYVEIQKEIFPSLRRTRIIVKYDEEGYSDVELKQLALTNPSIMTYEELMKAGAVTEDLANRASIYQSAAGKSDADYRASNNVGVMFYQQNKIKDAEVQFKKAYGMSKTAETSNNMGIITRLSGDRKGAMTLYNEAGSSKETSYNKGIIAIQNGDYSSAVSNMSSFKTFNTALAKLLNKDNGGAKTEIDGSGDASAMADYLKAIIAARSNEANGVTTNLKSAAQKDNALLNKAKSDLEFRNFKDAVGGL